MNELPAGFGEPLHILAPFPWRALAWLALTLLLALAWALWRRLRRRLPAPMPSPSGPVAVDPGGSSEIVRIRRQYGEQGDYRGGCHALARFLREWGERTGQHPGRRRLETLTAREIAFAVGEAPLGALFQLVAELQFRRRPPTREDFYGACDLADAVVPRDVRRTG